MFVALALLCFVARISANTEFMKKAVVLETQKPQGCPSYQPSACNSYSSCQCIDSGSFYFYKCDGMWCNNACEGCHHAEEMPGSTKKAKAACDKVESSSGQEQ